MKVKDSFAVPQQPCSGLFSWRNESARCVSFISFQIHVNIILLSMPSSSKWFPSLRFPTINLFALLFCLMHISCPIHLILYYMVILTVLQSEQYKLCRSSLRNFLHSPISLSRLGPDTFLSKCTQAPPVRAIPVMLLTKFNIYTERCHNVFQSLHFQIAKGK